MRCEIVIENALLADGSGGPAYLGSLGLRDGRIAEVAEAPCRLQGEEVIDARGLVLAPGFVDVHSHGDFLPLLGEEYRYSRLKQGITTELVGQCGISALPHYPETMWEYREYAAPVLGSPAEGWNFTGLLDYEALIRGRMPHNMAFLCGLGALRAGISGLSSRALTDGEIQEMARRYEQELEAGAFGLSLGLSYLPGVFAREEELLALGAVTAHHGALIMAHVRSHGKDMLEAMEELVSISRKTGARIHVSHARSYQNKDFGVAWEEIVAFGERVREEGVPLTMDQHPYTAGSTFLNQLLPPAYRRLECLTDKALLREVESAVMDPGYAPAGWDNFIRMVGYGNILVPTRGGTLEDLAKKEGVPPFQMLAEILIQEEMNAPMVVREMFSLEDAANLLRAPYTYVGSDGLPAGIPHPRLYGAFPKILGEYVREQGILTLEEAIAKMAGGAALLGLSDRGLLRPGYIADLVLFDPRAIGHKEAYGVMGEAPEGIAGVWLGGRLAYDGKNVLGDLGMVLRRKEDAS